MEGPERWSAASGDGMWERNATSEARKVRLQHEIGRREHDSCLHEFQVRASVASRWPCMYSMHVSTGKETSWHDDKGSRSRMMER